MKKDIIILHLTFASFEVPPILITFIVINLILYILKNLYIIYFWIDMNNKKECIITEVKQFIVYNR